jgi:hypothetical protein
VTWWKLLRRLWGCDNQRDLIKAFSEKMLSPFGASSPKEKGEIFRAVLEFALLLWRRWPKAG